MSSSYSAQPELLNTVAGFIDHYRTSYELREIYRTVDPCQFLRFKTNGVLQAEPSKKGNRDVSRFDLFQVQEFIFTPQAGKFQIKPITIRLNQIAIDPRFQFRSAFTDESLGSMVEGLKRGDRFPPMVVVLIGGQHFVVAGHRRKRAYELAVIPSVEVLVLPGGLREAIVYSARDNQTNGDKPRGKAITSEVLRQLDANPVLKAEVLAGRVSHRKYAKLFRYPPTPVYRAFLKAFQNEGQPGTTYICVDEVTETVKHRKGKSATKAEACSSATIEKARAYLSLETELAKTLGLKGRRLRAKIDELAAGGTPKVAVAATSEDEGVDSP